MPQRRWTELSLPRWGGPRLGLPIEPTVVGCYVGGVGATARSRDVSKASTCFWNMSKYRANIDTFGKRVEGIDMSGGEDF